MVHLTRYFPFLCTRKMAGILHRKGNSAHLYDITNIVNELLINLTIKASVFGTSALNFRAFF